MWTRVGWMETDETEGRKLGEGETHRYRWSRRKRPVRLRWRGKRRRRGDVVEDSQQNKHRGIREGTQRGGERAAKIVSILLILPQLAAAVDGSGRSPNHCAQLPSWKVFTAVNEKKREANGRKGEIAPKRAARRRAAVPQIHFLHLKPSQRLFSPPIGFDFASLSVLPRPGRPPAAPGFLSL